MTYDDLLIDTRQVDTVEFFNQVASYINENIIDFNYDINDFFLEDDDNTTDTDEENKEEKPKTDEQIQAQNKKMLDQRAWYQKLWDGIVTAWRWLTVNISKFFTRLFKKQSFDRIFIDGPKLNKRIDSLIEAIASRNPGEDLKNEDDVKTVKEYYKALLSEIDIFNKKIHEHEVGIEGASSNTLYSTAFNRIKTLDKSKNFYSQVADSTDGKLLYKAYIMELNHLKFLTKEETLKSYSFQNYKIVKSYERLSSFVDIFVTAFKGLQNLSNGSYEIGQKTVDNLTNAFHKGPQLNNTSFEEYGGDLLLQSISALFVKMIYIYSTDNEFTLKADSMILPHAAKLDLMSKHMQQLAATVPELKGKLEKFVKSSQEDSNRGQLLQQDLSALQTNYNSQVGNTIELLDSYFSDSKVDTSKGDWIGFIKNFFTRGKNLENSKSHMMALSGLMGKMNNYCLKVIKMSNISAQIDKRFLMLINAQKF